jgi:hypothetical protein
MWRQIYRQTLWLCVGLIALAGAARAATPALLTDGVSTRGLALETIGWTREPFAVTQQNLFDRDTRTRLTLFAMNLDLPANENGAALVTAEAEDGARVRYPLTVEYAGNVPGVDWLSAVVVRLHDNLSDVGDVLIGINVRGLTSNRVRVGIGHIGGGPPDDLGGPTPPPIPTPVPTATPIPAAPTPTATPTPTSTPAPTANSTPTPRPDLGANASTRGKRVFPADNAWNQDISAMPVDPNSANLIASMNADASLHPDFGTVYNGAPNGIPYIIVSGAQAKVPINFTSYGDESDPGPYPVPPNAPIEGGPNGSGDRHVIVIDRDNWILYELFSAFPVNNGASWNAASGAIFDLKSNALRPAGWTSADAAGLPIFPGLVRYDEVFERTEITHALRFTARNTRRAYVAPARHFASSSTDPNRPPMGMRVRLKASFDISGFSPNMQVILRTLKKYGMILADNGSNWFISGAPDPRWDDDELHTLQRIKGSSFEVVQMGTIVTR